MEDGVNGKQLIMQMRRFQDSCTGMAWNHTQRAISLVATAAGLKSKTPKRKKPSGKRKAKKEKV